MNRSRLLFILVSAAIILPLVTGTFLGAADDDGDDSIFKYLSVFTEVLGLVRQGYVEPVDVDRLMAGAFHGTSDALDAFSLYVPADHVQTYLRVREVGSGRSGLKVFQQRGITYVGAVSEDSPAAAAGLRPGDVVARIDGRSTEEIRPWELQHLLAGEPGTRLKLEVMRQGEPHELSLELASFEPPEAELDEMEGVAVLRIPYFGPQAGGQVAELLGRESEEAAALLVDLRGVAFGEPESAYQVAELFASGELGALVNRAGPVRSFAAATQPRWQGRVAVLVDRATLGPAEILASVLRQKVGAGLVGEETFGYAGHQEAVELSSGGYVVLTDAFYTGPDLEPLDQPLEPDELVDRFALSFLEGDASGQDLILERGLRYLRGEEEEEEEAEKR